ncbi:Protein altered xyloglucan 4-like [Vitis vinifera]|uniref:Protein altered xyloglucan 4-like n=1 Tax=Vitis vinifera TaxID=29760 RepID=A0A438EG12_VITVI|nr:Protein altered xyloglucan 4-like [Vitis vinifera]
MKSSASLCEDRERCLITNMGRFTPLLFGCTSVTFIFSIFILFSPLPLAPTIPKQLHQDDDHTTPSSNPIKGHWVPDEKGSSYTNWSCTTIPDSKNCFKHGRKDTDFVNWRWKPQGCHLPRFDPATFFRLFQGKKLAFVGDSVSRNHMESLLCLLSQEEVPRDIYKDSEDRFRTWYFPRHDFTLMILWSKFLVEGEERMSNGTASGVYDLYLDKIDNSWAQKVPEIDFAIISNAHWFFRPMYLHKGGKVMGCVYCNEEGVEEVGVEFALRMAFRAAFEYINGCEKCKGMVTLLRTFSPAHFENGSWNTGGGCSRTSPLGEGEVDLASFERQLGNIQVEEMERAKRGGDMRVVKFGALDVTTAMLMRPDGHPGAHWGNKWMKGYNDCVHWCLPGPIDAWNDILLAVLVREAG